MRKKLNEPIISHQPSPRRSNFYQRFRNQFDRLLDQDKLSRHFADLGRIFVPQDLLLADLSDFRTRQQDCCVFLIGLTGIGKSTNLRNLYPITEQRPFILKTTWFSQFFVTAPIMNGINIRKKVGDMVETVCDVLKNHYSLSFTEEELYDFIEVNKPEVLARARQYPSPTKTENINWLYKDYKFEYATELLKLFLLDPHVDIDDFIIIMDDVDSIKDWEALESLIHQACQVWECLKNNANKKYNVKLLIAERPETHWQLINKIDWFTAYIWSKPVYVTTVPALDVLFKKRFDHITEDLGGPDVRNIEKWKTAYESLHKISQSLATTTCDLITCLSNYNVRAALSTIEQALALGTWFEKSPSGQYYFETTDEQFLDHIDLLSVLRSIAYQGRVVYVDSDETRVPNILVNDKDPRADLVGPYIIKYFLIKEPKEPRYEQSVRITDLLSDIPYMFVMQEGMAGLFSRTIGYFKGPRRVLFISPHDKGDGTQLHLSPRGRMLWDLLGQTSILLDFYREDLWLDEAMYDLTGTLRLSVDERFVEEMNLIQSYAEEEIRVLEMLNTPQAKRKYCDCFGSDTIAEHLFSGVRSSMKKYYRRGRPEVISEKLTETVHLVEDAKMHLRRIHE